MAKQLRTMFPTYQNCVPFYYWINSIAEEKLTDALIWNRMLDQK